MDEVVASISRVTGIMNEINTATGEQREGIEQINLAITSMDSVTQQNAALVEQAAAAASSMQEEAARLSAAVGVFKLADAAPRMATARIMRSAPRVAPKQPAPALTQGADSWEEF
jgi:methyl-accepting chemotaxis protein